MDKTFRQNYFAIAKKNCFFLRCSSNGFSSCLFFVTNLMCAPFVASVRIFFLFACLRQVIRLDCAELCFFKDFFFSFSIELVFPCAFARHARHALDTSIYRSTEGFYMIEIAHGELVCCIVNVIYVR